MRVAAWPEPTPVLRRMGFHDKACRVCGWRFFTNAGLREHRDEGCRSPSPAQVASWSEAGRRVAALNNTHRRRCSCGLESTASGLGIHQKATGHTGWASA